MRTPDGRSRESGVSTADERTIRAFPYTLIVADCVLVLPGQPRGGVTMNRMVPTALVSPGIWHDGPLLPLQPSPF